MYKVEGYSIGTLYRSLEAGICNSRNDRNHGVSQIRLFRGIKMLSQCEPEWLSDIRLNLLLLPL